MVEPQSEDADFNILKTMILWVTELKWSIRVAVY